MPNLTDRINAIEQAQDRLTQAVGVFVPQVAGYGLIAHMLLEVVKGIGGVDVAPFEAEIAKLDAAIAESQKLSAEWDAIRAQQLAAKQGA